MKIHLLIVLAVELFLAAAVAKAGYGTNSFYVTLEDGRAVTAERIEQSRTNSECRPAEEDILGHWSPITEGYQLSLRFLKESFLSNEPVVATIIFRNASTNHLLYATPFGGDLDFKIIIKDESGKLLPDSFRWTETSGQSTIFNPGIQYKFESNLTKRYGLAKPGKYSVFARRKIPRLDGTGWTQVDSEIILIGITTSPRLDEN